MNALQGVGLFSARPASIRLEPAPVLSLRVGAGPAFPITPALALAPGTNAWARLPEGCPIRNTTLRLPDGSVAATVEHALSALAGLGIWHACLVLEDGPEVPIDDGSARAFCSLAHALPPSRIEPLVLQEPVRVEDGRGGVVEATPLAPGEHATMTYSIDYAGVLRGSCSWNVGDADSYQRAIAPARTFSMEQEAKAAQAAGLFRHLTTRDMLVLDSRGQPIDNPLRFSDEPCRHKLLDLIGDLALLGRPLHARVRAHRSGHALAAQAAAAILATAS